MAIIIDSERDAVIKNQMTNAFFKHKRSDSLRPEPDEVEIDSTWGLVFDLPETPLTKKTEELFRRFLKKCMNVSLGDSGSKRIAFRIDERIDGLENSVIQVDDDGVDVAVSHEKGALHAGMRMLKIFSERKAPFLARGRIENSPRFSRRITSTMFYTSDLKLADVDEAFPHDYLALMAFHGVNGVFWEIDFHDYCGSNVLPELTCPDYLRNVEKLRSTVDRLAAYGIGMHFLYSVRVLPESHPLFQAHPEVKGAFVDIGKEEKGFCLCSSNEKALNLYEDALEKLHRDVPGLAGPILLVGGERFTHCFTRPAPPLRNKTNCAACAKRKPAEVVANMVNRVAAAARKASPDAEVLCWPYSAFTWSGPEDDFQLELLKNLSAEVCSLANFSTGEIWPDSGALLGDYNIMKPGPAARFKAQAAELAKRGKPIYAKAECSTTPFMFHVPYLPVLHRWAERAKALKEFRKNDVKGVFYHYRYYGFCGSVVDELAFASVWNDVEFEDFLKRYCLREYGEFSPDMLTGWRKMSDAWGMIPYSMALSGERQYYVKGPIYLGPAHPFVFTVQNDYGLKRGFTRIRGSVLFPDVSDEERETLSVPAYASDLMFTWPMGVEKCEAALLRLHDAWTAGAKTFSDSFRNPNDNAVLDAGICENIGIHFKTAHNLIRFYRQRDAFLSEGGANAAIIDEKTEEMKKILEEEIANCHRAIELLDKDPRLGYGYSYGIVYDADMIREKIAQCEHVINVEMPKLASGLRFHMFGVYP